MAKSCSNNSKVHVHLKWFFDSFWSHCGHQNHTSADPGGGTQVKIFTFWEILDDSKKALVPSIIKAANLRSPTTPQNPSGRQLWAPETPPESHQESDYAFKVPTTAILKRQKEILRPAHLHTAKSHVMSCHLLSTNEKLLDGMGNESNFINLKRTNCKRHETHACSQDRYVK